MENDDAVSPSSGFTPPGGSSVVGTRRGSDALAGRVIADRYRVERTVSIGGHAVIVDATDTEAGRLVTVKLIRPEFSEVEDFRRRFEQTMRAMSVLAHPNIAAVHDWGVTTLSQRTTCYVVVEYLNAGSLRDLFDRGRYLTPSQALVIGLEVCRALDYAHRRSIAHTEITPSKLVFGEDRRLRVIDFGLARLLGMAAWRDPATLPSHTARYASPEQALGRPLDGKTDVYALALTLIEAVTGSVPFAADSTTATLSGRVGKLMPVSADLGSLAAVLERAGRSERDDRWTAAEFGRALLQAAEQLPRPEPIPLVVTTLFADPPSRMPSDPTGGLERPAPPAPSAVAAEAPSQAPNAPQAPAVAPPPAEPPAAVAGDAPGGEATAAPTTDPDTPPPDEEPAAATVSPSSAGDTPPAAESAPEADTSGAEGASTSDPASAAVVPPADPSGAGGAVTTPPPADTEPSGAAAKAAAGDAATPAAPSGGPTAEQAPPSAQAKPAPSDGDDDVTRDELARLATSDTAGDAPGDDQAGVLPPPPGGDPLLPTAAGPGGGGSAESGDVGGGGGGGGDDDVPPERGSSSRRWPRVLVALLLVAALGGVAAAGYFLFRAERHEVPELTGLSVDDAQLLVEEYNWNVETRAGRSDDIPDEGDVIRTEPAAGEQLREGGQFLIIVSEGPEFRTLPELSELTPQEARGRLAGLELEGSVANRVHHEDVPQGRVVRWRVVGDPDLAVGDEVLPGREIALIVSRGPAPREVPDLSDLTPQEALAELDDLRLDMDRGERVFHESIEEGRVARQRPQPGNELERGETVTIRVSKGPDLVPFPDLEGLGEQQARRRVTMAGFEIADMRGAVRIGSFERAMVARTHDSPGDNCQAGSNLNVGDECVRGTPVVVVYLTDD